MSGDATTASGSASSVFSAQGNQSRHTFLHFLPESFHLMKHELRGQLIGGGVGDLVHGAEFELSAAFRFVLWVLCPHASLNHEVEQYGTGKHVLDDLSHSRAPEELIHNFSPVGCSMTTVSHAAGESTLSGCGGITA